MFLHLDKLAFDILLLLFSILGVKQSPEINDSKWTLVKQWERQEDQTYLLEIESTQIVNLCKHDPLGYVLFPQVYMGKQKIYIDTHLLYSNELSEKGSITSMYERAIIKCESLINGSKVIYQSNAYIKFFASFSSYPTFSKKYPGSQFFYNSIYLIASALCICLAIIGATLMWSIESKIKIFYFVLQEALFSLFMCSYGGGAVFELATTTLHSLVFFSFAGGFYLLITNEVSFLNSNKCKTIGLGILFILTLIGIGRRNLTQLLILSVITPYVILIVYSILIKIKKRENIFEISVFALVIVIGLKDAYVTTVSRDGATHLSVLVIIVSISNFFKVLKAVNKKKDEAMQLESKLILEKKSFINISKMYESYREIIHDLKSPITAINFALQRDTVSPASIKSIATRTAEILSRIEESGYRKVIDWYSVSFCEQCIKEVINEKQGSIHIAVNSKENRRHLNIELFFDPIDFKIVFTELLDNSIKASATEALFDFREDLGRYLLFYEDNGPGISDEIVVQIGRKGISKSSSGIGLAGVKSKIESWGGSIQILKPDSGFKIQIELKSRQISS